MDHSEELKNVAEKTGKSRAAKRKWREIEALKERHRLRKELMDIDYCFDCELEELEL
ncbi:DUF3545 family protein [Aliidiomarina maris]|uniref:DUF3545 domain-containing protein n=1 Tax=Aliidiomarina maris TaxID=531312 RepID=A0A327X3E8_9GAMM|nr:DUF3545 family protein [Aliidiomarina maris]MBA3988093.1 DUF3545 domain-containing protein [Idiomarina sp.]MCL5051306.1 DUF3545 family protein [Bacillota bacterium]RAK00660.1 uncharacterized protein DUF3545 [Aliidiomarina maris]RUO27332.1 DUF3545 domain-containing protein [Aliidiomarina maris]